MKEIEETAMFNNPENTNGVIKAPDIEQLLPAIEWMADQIPGGFFIYKAYDDLELLYVNRALMRIFACKTLEEFKELTGFTFKGIVHPDDFEDIQNKIDVQIDDPVNENLDYVEYRIIRKDGEVRWVDDYGYLADLPGYGNVYFVFIVDITEKHNLQEETRRRVDLFKGMIDQFNSLADNSLTVVRMNITKGIIEEARGRDLFDTDYAGAQISEGKQIRLESFIDPKDQKKYEEIFDLNNLLERYYKGDGPATLVAYCRRQSGRACFVKFSGSALVDPITHDVIAFRVETEYNTEKVTEILTEKVLVKQYDMVTYIVGDNYGVIIGDVENTEKGSIFPKKRDGSYSQYIKFQVLPATNGISQKVKDLDDALSLTRIAKELEDKVSYSVDVNCTIEGEVFNKRFTYYLVDANSRFFILLKSDITDVLKEEKKRNELLSAALHEAERANLAKTSFLSNMSHEIRTPMNAIIGYDTIALTNPDIPKSTKENLEKIGESAKHLLGLINNILDMSRIESGRIIMKLEEFSFRQMLEQINTMVQTQCSEKGIKFECRINGNVDDYYIGDDMKLKQVIINILSNSIKFTQSSGSISFIIEQMNTFDDNTTIKFVIKDTGIGMDKAFIPKIFDAFSQENSTTFNKFGSSGLGMAITKNIVELMNGTISVDSEKGVGTQFTLTIPLKNSDRKSFVSQTFDKKEMRVLIIDDEQVACQHARLVLEDVGISADTCLVSSDALKMIELQHAKQKPYSLILIDWQMPDINGIELTRKIREKYKDNTTIIILTAYNWDDILEDALLAGVDGFMSKPLFPSHVLAEFERIVKKKGLNKPKKETNTIILEGKHVLLAEDMAINAEIIKQILKMKKIDVDYAENGLIALEMFSKSKLNYYDAVLMDIRMPVMNGLEATTSIRALEREDAKEIPIIALTANAFDEDVQQSLQAGMTAHLSKPVEIDQLYKTLENLIGNPSH